MSCHMTGKPRKHWGEPFLPYHVVLEYLLKLVFYHQRKRQRFIVPGYVYISFYAELSDQIQKAMLLDDERKRAQEESERLENERLAALQAKEELERQAADQMKSQEQLVWIEEILEISLGDKHASVLHHGAGRNYWSDQCPSYDVDIGNRHNLNKRKWEGEHIP